LGPDTLSFSGLLAGVATPARTLRPFSPPPAERSREVRLELASAVLIK